MRKPIIYILVLLVVIVGVSVAFSLSKRTPSDLNSSSSNTETDSNYLKFSPEILARESDKKRVLYFYANWCPTCIPADKNISENTDKIPDNLAIIRVNYNDSDTDQAEKDLANKYSVTYQHTFVQVDAFGNEITKWNGGDLSDILLKIK